MLKVLLPKGRIYDNVCALLSDVGINIYVPERTYFPLSNRKDLSFQIVKPQIASLLLSQGKADLCFSGADWVSENQVGNKVQEVLDLGFDPVKIVAAIPVGADFDALKKSVSDGEGVTIATEYQTLSDAWLKSQGLKGKIFRTWGTSEGFVQGTAESLAQILIDNTSTGSSLKANNLKIVDTLMESSTRMYTISAALADSEKKQQIEELAMLFDAVLKARARVMLEMNVAEKDFEALVEALPSMKSPTVSPLFGDGGFAIKTVVKKNEVASLLPKLKALGAQDIIEYELRKVIE